MLPGRNHCGGCQEACLQTGIVSSIGDSLHCLNLGASKLAVGSGSIQGLDFRLKSPCKPIMYDFPSKRACKTVLEEPWQNGTSDLFRQFVLMNPKTRCKAY